MVAYTDITEREAQEAEVHRPRAAVEMLAGRAHVAVELEGIPDERLPEPVEAAALGE
jgi:hypothetical protein